MSDETTMKTPEISAPTGGIRDRALDFLPLIITAIIIVFLGVGLLFLNPKEIPSVLISKPVPAFDLPPVQGRLLGLKTDDLKGEVSLVNVFASWCLACRAEHPLLMGLAKNGDVPIHGLNYRDQPQDAANWLDRLGDPYTRTGADVTGRVAIEWGVYGVPETFIVGSDGLIAHEHIGAITAATLREQILPLVRQLRRRGQD
jgi:cytochrome c biogenesis protein CcmG, thiol:disulfide interchange protein DsbE